MVSVLMGTHSPAEENGVGTAALGRITVVTPGDAAPQVRLAAKETARYVYLRTGKVPVVAAQLPAQGDAVVFATNPSLGAEAHAIKTTAENGRRVWTISGGSDLGVLYGSYQFAGKLGVRFYLHGDVVPDERLAALPNVNEQGKPLFELRGIQPFHDFPEGPDWWNKDDYLAYVSQLAKMRMNFLGMHCYPAGNVGPELLAWIGLAQDLDANGNVTSSYPAYWKNTADTDGFNYAAMKTSGFAGGAAELFAADDHGPDVMAGAMPRPVTPAQCNEVFNRVGRQMGNVFAQARRLGVKTCIGTETPLTIPPAVRERLQQLGRNPDDINVVRELYTGMFKRIAAACPVDYYWLWTPEGWTWGGNNPDQFAATQRDIQAALDALAELKHPFTLATCGWVLGPAHNRAALDEILPKSSPISCINRNVGHDGVEPAFANLTGRPKWAIPWLENDPNMVGPQPWVARMRHDAVDALRFGCTGLFGIHWRTKALAPNISALAAAAWDQSWVPADYGTRPVKPTTGGEGALGGMPAGFTAPVADAAVQAVYQNVRYDLNGYSLAIPDGTYTVTLQFNEPAYSAASKRVFGAAIQGNQVFKNLDIFARVGGNKALDLGFPNIAVTDGTLRIDFTREVEFPCIAGIVVEGKTKAVNQLPGQPFTRKINCGGASVADYEADRLSGGTALPAPIHRAMPAADFYLDFARANFGESVAEPAGRLFAKMDGRAMPEPSAWGNGPGNLNPNPQPWSEARARYAFVDELAALRPQVTGAGNLDRFDYWLNTWQAAAAMAEASCARGQLDQAMAAKKIDEALTHRIDLARVWGRLMSLQASIVSTPGELGTIANLEQHTRKYSHFLDAHDAALSQALGAHLPPQASPPQAYTGPAKLILPTVRSSVGKGETLTLKILALDSQPVKSVALRVRPLGQGEWQTIPVKHISRAVHEAVMPPAQEDFEYHITALTADGRELVWPATAPDLNQTVVVWANGL